MTVIKPRDAASSLLKKGFHEKPDGDHKYYFFYYQGLKTSIWTRISHNSDDIRDTLISLMKKQLKLDKDQFIDLIECPLSQDQYIKILQEQGLINNH